ncbi:MAG: hypothetical protein IJ735_06770 [Clostridia bacterium]|nr:hypothetical protein [Clostridia bacterium]
MTIGLFSTLLFFAAASVPFLVRVATAIFRKRFSLRYAVKTAVLYLIFLPAEFFLCLYLYNKALHVEENLFESIFSQGSVFVLFGHQLVTDVVFRLVYLLFLGLATALCIVGVSLSRPIDKRMTEESAVSTDEDPGVCFVRYPYRSVDRLSLCRIRS